MRKIPLKHQNYARYFILFDLIFKTTLPCKISPFTEGETGSEVLNDLLKVTQPKIRRVNLNLGQARAEHKMLYDPAILL